MSVRTHRSEAPLPRTKRPAQRHRESLEERGQIALDWNPTAGAGVSAGAAPSALKPEASAHPTTRTQPSRSSISRPTPEDCAREPWRAFQ